MRLTLRTLLAWLDDTLPPVQVREIGKQVGSSPLAQELVQRIHRVTRQRRLTVPSKNGPDATDPNLVASYLDNDLNAEQVAEYEKKCLTSDVNLAEAASVHQILSLLGQKVHVPPEAKGRMYLLVKGRESQGPGSVDAEHAEPDPKTQPFVPWTVQKPAQRHWLERFGPAAACLALVGILSWAAYDSLKSDGGPAGATASVPARAGVPTKRPAPVEPPAPAPGKEAPALASAETPDDMPPIPDDAMDDPKAEPAEAEPADKAAAAPPAPSVDVPAGAAAAVARVEGMLLRFDGDKREWVRSRDGEALHSDDRLMTPPASTARLSTPAGTFSLLEDSEIHILPDDGADGPTLELVRGRLVAEPSSTARPLHVSFQGQTLDMERPADLAVGFESDSPWTYGQAQPAPPALGVHVGPGGELALSSVKAKEKVKGPANVRVDAAGVVTRSKDAATPDWLAGTPGSAEQTALREGFLKEFSDDRPVLADVVSATDSVDAQVKRMAVACLRGLGDLSLLTPILDRPNDPAARQAAIDAIRRELTSGDAASRRAWDQIQLDFGAVDRARLGNLLLGFPPEEAEKPATLERLVDDLSTREESLAMRELAFDNLKRLTGRDAPAYDADRPEQGHAAWRKILDDGQLKPAAKK